MCYEKCLTYCEHRNSLVARHSIVGNGPIGYHAHTFRNPHTIALSIATACPELSVWAALSTSGIKGLVLPATVKTVILCPDGDPEGREAARQAAGRFLEQGRQVKIAEAPAGADLNDVLQGQAR